VHFAVVLLIESDEPQKNQQATLAIETSLMQIAQQMAFMPKRIQAPPVLVRLTPEDAVQHHPFLRELGIQDRSAPATMILYGRLRTMGPVFFGEDITDKTLTAYLSVIGADCECDLDRRLLHTPMLIHHWPRPMYEAATEALGFDPEHPEVKMEISQIIADHGPVDTGDLKIPEVAFGYQEFVIDDSTMPLAESDGAHLDTSVTAADNRTPEKRVHPLALPITPSGKLPLYGLFALACAVIVTGIIIVCRKR
jgi:hypothetical protein